MISYMPTIYVLLTIIYKNKKYILKLEKFFRELNRFYRNIFCNALLKDTVNWNRGKD